MTTYEEIINRQATCITCMASPPGPETEYECPNCLRITTKEIYDDFHKRNSKDDIQKRYIAFLEAYTKLYGKR